MVRGAAGAVADAQDVFPIRPFELVDETLKSIQELDPVGGDVVALHGGVEDESLKRDAILGSMIKSYFREIFPVPEGKFTLLEEPFSRLQKAQCIQSSMKSNSTFPVDRRTSRPADFCSAKQLYSSAVP